MNADDKSTTEDAAPYNGNNRFDIPMNVLDGNVNLDRRSIAAMDAQSLHSIDVHGPSPTTPEENSRLTRQYFSLVMSIIYAVLLVTLGLIIYPGNTITDTPHMSMIYSICLYAIGFVYILFLMIDISRCKYSALKNQKSKTTPEEQDGLMNPVTIDAGSPEVLGPLPASSSWKPKYCFSEGRHAESFYLKLGATGFAIGHLVHSMLQLVVELGYLMDENVNNDYCLSKTGIALGVITPCYCILQLYFMFKYSNVIILRLEGLAHFAFMHMIGSSLCFWISAIVRDSTLTLTIYAHSVYGKGNKSLTYNQDQIAKKLGTLIDIQGLYKEQCSGSEAINTIMGKFAPYLYPFTVEFNILIVAVYYIIWSNIGNRPENHSNGALGRPSDEDDDDRDEMNSNIMIHADCSSSIRGLFAGIVLMVFVIGNIILGFVLGTVGGKFQKAGYFLKDVVMLGLHSLMLLASVAVYNKLRSLDINNHPMSLLDDVLLFICLPAFFMETVLSMIATVNILNVLKCIDVVVMVVQVVIQTQLIMDGLRRCSNSKKLRRSKPGRELLMFLLIANVSMWLFYTFSYKSPESLDERYEFYGKVLWTVLGHISLPLIMFYRFHSSVCFADIWDSAYKPGEH